MSTVTGPDLKAEREDADITGRALAAEMGVHPTRVSQIESLASVSRRAERRYREALGRLRQLPETHQRASA